MRDFLKPSDYAVIQATLPLVARFDCRKTGSGTFKQFWDLPLKVQSQIETYRPPEAPPQSPDGDRHMIDRFEVYEGDDGRLLLFAFVFPHEFEEWAIECVGQYLSDIFVGQPQAVSMRMLEKMQAMSTQKWSWRALLKPVDQKDSGVFLGIVLTFFLSGVGFWLAPPWPSFEEPLNLRLLEYFMCVFVFGSGPFILTVAVAQSWIRFRKRRSQLVETLNRYLNAIPQQARHA